MTTYSEPYKPIFIGRPLTGGGWLDYYPSPKFATPSIPISLLDAGLPACLPVCFLRQTAGSFESLQPQNLLYSVALAHATVD